MSYQYLILEKSEGIATVTLNRPEALNALNAQLRWEIVKALEECGDDEAVRVVVIKGAGRAFCAGDDLKEIASGAPPMPLSRQKGPEHVVFAIRDIRKPVIVALHGFAFGAGLEIAMAADMRIAAEGTRFAEPYVQRGIVFGGYLLPRYIGLAKASEMLFTGDPIGAEEGLQLGLLNYVVPPEQLENTVRRWAERFARAATAAIGGIKTIINRGMSVDIEEGFAYTVHESMRAFQTEDIKEGVRAFVEKREPQFKGK